MYRRGINGWNPMNWDCEKQGCFNKKRRPKIEFFCDCFYGNSNFGDVDGLVEQKGNGCLLEWKPPEIEEISIGQRVAYEKLSLSTNGHLTCFIVAGDPETMKIERYCFYHKGQLSRWIESDLESLKERFRSWCKWARSDGYLNGF